MSPPLPERADRSGGLSFPLVASVFALLLALGVALGFAIHARYVAFERVAARHVPDDATVVLRWDVEKVSLFEPTRRYLLPLLDVSRRPPATPEPGSEPRRRRVVNALGLDVGRDLREVVVLFGPAPGDWALVLGGSFPHAASLEGFRAVLDGEGWTLRGDISALVSPEGAALGRASDGAFVLASSSARLQATLPVRPLNEAVPRTGAGALLVRAERELMPEARHALSRLGDVSRIEGRATWGNPLVFELEVLYRSTVPSDARARVGALLAELLTEKDMPRIDVAAAGAERAVTFRLLLEQGTLETTARRASEGVLSALGKDPLP